MTSHVSAFVLQEGATLMSALRAIDANRHGFLIVTKENGFVIGTATDGDIRRALIKGADLNEPISVAMSRSCTVLKRSSDVLEAIELFKKSTIKFLPIVDEDGRLVNILTKAQLHALLLQNEPFGLNCDFQNVDGSVIDHEIYPRPWGFFKTTVLNRYFRSKIISVKPRSRLSLQSHDHREEFWIAVHGKGRAVVGESEVNLSGGKFVHIPIGCKHRIVNDSENENLIITEVQIGDYLGEDDIVRYSDDYGRIN